MTKERKEEIIKTYRRDEKDTVSPEVQVAHFNRKNQRFTRTLKS